MPPTRDQLGRFVRDNWLLWARAQPKPKPSWLVEWEHLAEPEKEVDRLIGEALYALGAKEAENEIAQLREDLMKLQGT